MPAPHPLPTQRGIAPSLRPYIAQLSKRELLLTAESDLLEEAGIIVSRETWRRKEIRVNTKLVYQQRKFNLLREESEGYAKLTTLLHQSGAGRLTAETVPQVARDVLALIGFFDLDPNRVVSVLLGAWAEQAHNEAFLQLLAEFKCVGRLVVG